MVSTKILSSTTVFNTDNNNVCWATNQHIRMISEGSCDTEDLSNGTENSAFYLNYILKSITVFTVFYQINAAFKDILISWPQTFER